jgi:glycosyltransferase involved in cell wall biosynthesis
MNWAILVGMYGRAGGVSDYTTLVAHALVNAGDEVTVYASAPSLSQLAERRFRVVELPGSYGAPAHRALDLAFKNRMPDRVLVQYVPQVFGWRGTNLLFCLWLHARRNRYPIWMMYHEVLVGFARRLVVRRNLLALATNLMARLTARAASRIFIAALAWERNLRPMIPDQKPILWTPVPSNIPVFDDPAGVSNARRHYLSGYRNLVGHFGTYGSLVANPLAAALAVLFEQRTDTRVLLLGAHGLEFMERFVAENTEFTDRIAATGALPAEDVSRHVRACDLMIQPYPDGVTTRQTTIMVSLAHGVPVVTNSGPATENIWREYRAVHMTPADNPAQLGRHAHRLLSESAELKRLSAAGKALYEDRFALQHTINALRLEAPDLVAV